MTSSWVFGMFLVRLMMSDLRTSYHGIAWNILELLMVLLFCLFPQVFLWEDPLRFTTCMEQLPELEAPN